MCHGKRAIVALIAAILCLVRVSPGTNLGGQKEGRVADSDRPAGPG